MPEFDVNQEELAVLVQPARLERLREVVEHRTQQLTVILEMVEKGHNQSAILRTCDAFGILDVHLVERPKKRFKPTKGQTQGVHKWLNMHRYTSTLEAVQHLKQQGYQVWASHLDPEAKPLPEVDLTGKIALLFGNEMEGILPETRAACDGSFVIPMFGFSQSFNVSVAAAITLYEASRQRLKQQGHLGDLTPEEKETLLKSYKARSISRRVLRELQRRESCSNPEK